MHQTLQQTDHKSFDSPDEVREFPKGKADILFIGGGEVGRYTVEPGWSWSEHIKPIAGTESCEAPHFQYHVAGTLADPDGRRRPSSTSAPARSACSPPDTTPGSSATSPSR